MKNMQAYVCVDNFFVKGVRRDLHDFLEQLKSFMWAKIEAVLGPDHGQEDAKEVVCLNLVFRWCVPAGGRAEAIKIEADARHADIVIHQFNLRWGPKVALMKGLQWVVIRHSIDLESIVFSRFTCVFPTTRRNPRGPGTYAHRPLSPCPDSCGRLQRFGAVRPWLRLSHRVWKLHTHPAITFGKLHELRLRRISNVFGPSFQREFLSRCRAQSRLVTILLTEFC